MPMDWLQNNPDEFDTMDELESTLVERDVVPQRAMTSGEVINSWGYLNGLAERPEDERDIGNEELAMQVELVGERANEAGVDLDDPVDIEGFDAPWYDGDDL